MATPPDFVAGNVLTAAQMNKIGLWLVKSQTIGTTVSSVTVNNAFSADYDAYFVKISGGLASTNTGLNLTLGGTTAGYYRAGTAVAYNSATVTGFNTSNGAAFFEAFSATAQSIDGNCWITNPFLADQTSFYSLIAQTQTVGNNLSIAGYLNDTNSYTAFTLTTASGTITGGTIRVYGYRN